MTVLAAFLTVVFFEVQTGPGSPTMTPDKIIECGMFGFLLAALLLREALSAICNAPKEAVHDPHDMD